jgi:capsular polysaccharide biosynthesis protein
VPAVEGALRQVIADSFAMLRIDASLVLRAGPEPVRFDRLILVEGLTHHGVYMSPLVLECIDSLSAGIDGTGAEKLFVTRGGPSRRLIDEAEIQQRAVANGYTLLSPGNLPLAQQIAAFKNAREIVGVMGAELTNIAFAPAGARVLNIAPAGMPDTFVWFIAGLRGHSYSELRCAQSGPIRGIARWDTDLALDPSDLRDLFGPAA